MDARTADLSFFINRALEQMTAIVLELGDARVNEAPTLEGANSPYAILTHCVGVMSYWGGYVAVGRPITRDRDAEFRAHGSVAELLTEVDAAKKQIANDLSIASLDDPVANIPDSGYDSPREVLLQGTVFLHVFEELFQHCGQMEITRDISLKSRW
jgi:hypothetical protein